MKENGSLLMNRLILKQLLKLIKVLSVVLPYFLFLSTSRALGWGFFAHRQINKHATFTLPPALFSFYKRHLHYITTLAVNPDKRRYVLESEAPRHFIDLDAYGPHAWKNMPRYWSQALAAYPEDLLLEHGTLPWHIFWMKKALTRAFQRRDVVQIVRLSADIGHYIADAHVPLHTSENYNGQLTGQEGIHALWESRLPELFWDRYDLFTDQATYLPDPQKKAWEAVVTAHKAVPAALGLEKQLSKDFPAMQQYSFEQRGGTLQRVYSYAYAQAYHTLLAGQVERQARAAIKLIGDFWLTCWVDAGQPELGTLQEHPLPAQELQEDFATPKRYKVRACGE